MCNAIVSLFREPSYVPRSPNLWTQLILLALLVYSVPAMRGNTVYFATNPQNLTVSATTWGVNALATFDINTLTNTVVVHLNNLLINPTDADQLLGSVRFTMSGRGLTAPAQAQPKAVPIPSWIGSSGRQRTWRMSPPGFGDGAPRGTSTQLNVTLCAVCARRKYERADYRLAIEHDWREVYHTQTRH